MSKVPVAMKASATTVLTSVATVGVPPSFTRLTAAGMSPSRDMAKITRGAMSWQALTAPSAETIMIVRMTVSPEGPNTTLAARTRRRTRRPPCGRSAARRGWRG